MRVRGVHDGRVRPREWLLEPALFGKSLRAQWRPVPTTEGLPLREAEAERSAALLQHRFSISFDAQLRDRNLMVKDVAEAVGVEASHLSHVLRGRQAITLRMMLLLVVELDDVSLFPAPASIAEMQPDT